jgi:hypothetical protein
MNWRPVCFLLVRTEAGVGRKARCSAKSGHGKCGVQMPAAQYLTTRLFMVLLKLQGQYSVRLALDRAISEMSATRSK